MTMTKCRLALAGCWLLTGCAVGPDFHKPGAPDVARYTAQPLPVAPEVCR